MKILKNISFYTKNALEFRLGNERTGSIFSSCIAPGHFFLEVQK